MHFKRDIQSFSVVQFGTKYYKRQHGIAQGSRLSTLLCSFFFGRLEQEKLGYLKEDTEGVSDGNLPENTQMLTEIHESLDSLYIYR